MDFKLPKILKGWRKRKKNIKKALSLEEESESKKVIMIARCSAPQGTENLKMGSKTYLVLREMTFMRTTECPCSICSSTSTCSDKTECHCEDDSQSISSSN